MKKILFFDCFAGISGDMTIGALLDLGVDQEQFIHEINKLQLHGYELEMNKSIKKGITGTSFHVHLTHHHHDHEDHHHHDHRNLFDVEKIIDDSDVKDSVKVMSKNIFRLVAEAEAKIHGKSLDEVHFHEVGAIDSIIDIVGAAVCMDLLGVDEVYASPLHVGTGFVHCAHGVFPVPAPATLEILKGVPIYNKGIETELVTPTGAAIVKALSEGFGDVPAMELHRIGYGLGKKDLDIPNVLRVYLGEKKTKKVV
jgi:uncharacterized protein (TIGR00299 family) protein